MKLTKYQHACFTVEDDGRTLVVDPGSLAEDFEVPKNVVGVVVTHEHPDHLDVEKLTRITEQNPDAVIFAHPDVVAKIDTLKTRAVLPGDHDSAGPFKLEFFGGQHALIHSSLPRIANIGVMINGRLYYPGDALHVPTKPIEILAIPAGAPWLKIGQAMDYLAEIKPRLAFPTHDAVLSQAGKGFADNLLGMIAKECDITYQRINGSIEL